MPTRLPKAFACLAVVIVCFANASPAADVGGGRHESVCVAAPFAMPAIQIPVFPQRDFVITNFGASEGGKTDIGDATRQGTPIVGVFALPS